MCGYGGVFHDTRPNICNLLDITKKSLYENKNLHKKKYKISKKKIAKKCIVTGSLYGST